MTSAKPDSWYGKMPGESRDHWIDRCNNPDAYGMNGLRKASTFENEKPRRKTASSSNHSAEKKKSGWETKFARRFRRKLQFRLVSRGPGHKPLRVPRESAAA